MSLSSASRSLPSVVTNVVIKMPTPAVPSRTRLRTRARIGFGRRLRGTAQAMFIAFWVACATPSAP